MNEGTLYMGVDPGAEGYIALLGSDGWAAFQAIPRKGGKMDLPGLVAYFKGVAAHWKNGAFSTYSRLVCVLEEVNAMPHMAQGPGGVKTRHNMGATSAFSFGRGFGRIEAAVVAFGVPLTLVRPGVWKKEVLLQPERDLKKDGSVVACERLFPAANLPTNTKGRVNHNAADALCIAEYGRRHNL